MLVEVPTSGDRVRTKSAAGLPALLVLGQGLAGRGAALVRGADAHQLGRQLAPHPLGVGHREQGQIDREAVGDRAVALDGGSDPLAVLGPQGRVLVDPALEVLAALREVLGLGPGLEQGEGVLPGQAGVGEDALDLLLVGQGRMVRRLRRAFEVPALERVGDHQRRARGPFAGIEQGAGDDLHVVSPEVLEGPQQLLVAQLLEHRRRARHQLDRAFTDGGGIALEDQHLVLVVGQRALEQLADRVALGAFEQLLPEGAVAQLHHVPTVAGGRALDAVAVRAVQRALVGDPCSVEVLAVVVDDPGHVPQLPLGHVGQRLEQRALAELGVPDQRPEVCAAGDAPTVVGRVAVRQRQVHRDDRRDADRAGRQEMVGIQVRARVVALEDVGALLGGELAQAEHRRLGFLLGDPTSGLGTRRAAEEAQQVMKGVIDRGGVRLAAHVVLGLARDQVQRGEDVDARGARGRVTTDLGVAGSLVVAVVRDVDHVHGLREGAGRDALEDGEVDGLVGGALRSHQFRQRSRGPLGGPVADREGPLRGRRDIQGLF